MKLLRSKVRATARNWAIDTFWMWGELIRKNSEAFERPRVHIPYFHDVPPNEKHAFRKFVSVLSEQHTFISYSEAIERIVHGPIDKPYIAFSFDDGFASNEWTSRVLEEFGTTGCFFIPPGFIDSTLSTADAMKAFGFAAGTYEPPMTWSELENMKTRGHEIGNHTLNHKTLSQLSSQQATDEIEVGAERIRDVLGDCSQFAWPRCRFKHFNRTAAHAVFNAGHNSIASAERGAHVAPLNSDARLLCVRRDHEMTSWPLHHRMYFIASSSQRATPETNFWPQGWNHPS